MKIVIINGSHRVNGNCSNFSQKAFEILSNKHQVSVFNLKDMIINKCNGCLKCEEVGECEICDDYSKIIVPALYESELIVFATPTYFNMPSALLVNFLDRTNCLCEYFAENEKKVFTYISGQTDESSMKETYRCLSSYYEIMCMKEIESPVFHVARLKENLPNEIEQLIGMI